MVSLPDRWILDRYIRMLGRVLHAARAHASHSHKGVVARLTECIDLQVPDLQSADQLIIETYLNEIGKTVVDTRYACNDLFDCEGKPYRFMEPDESGAGRLISPGCEAAMSLLDAVDCNVTDMLVRWGQDIWCRPRVLYDGLRRHEIEYESGLARFTGFLNPVDQIAPSRWRCDS